VRVRALVFETLFFFLYLLYRSRYGRPVIYSSRNVKHLGPGAHGPVTFIKINVSIPFLVITGTENYIITADQLVWPSEKYPTEPVARARVIYNERYCRLFSFPSGEIKKNRTHIRLFILSVYETQTYTYANEWGFHEYLPTLSPCRPYHRRDHVTFARTRRIDFRTGYSFFPSPPRRSGENKTINCIGGTTVETIAGINSTSRAVTVLCTYEFSERSAV
jgi:hypothetical protein